MSAAVVLSVPTAGWAQVSSVDTACVTGSDGQRRGGVTGRVRLSDGGSALPGARIRIRVVSGPADHPAVPPQVTSNREGIFRICDLPPGLTLELSARRGPAQSRPSRVWVARDSVLRRDLIVPMHEAGRLTGTVLDHESQDPVEGVSVALPELGIAVATSSRGEFTFPLLPPGRYRLRLSHLAYGERSDSVSVVPERSVRLEMLLVGRPIDVEPLEVRVVGVRSFWLEANGFYSRRNEGAGYFFTREDIKRRRPVQLSDLFRRVPGVRVDRDGGLTMSRASASSGRPCPLQFFIDGRSVPLAVGVDAFPPGDIEAIEVYRGASEVPPEFNEGSAACGAVVLWMRSVP